MLWVIWFRDFALFVWVSWVGWGSCTRCWIGLDVLHPVDLDGYFSALFIVPFLFLVSH